MSAAAIPKAANPLYVLIIAYATGIALLAIFALFYSTEKSLVSSFKEANWAVYVVGIGAAFIEIGFLLAYRFGWDISKANVIASIGTAVLLIPIGIVLFKERISVTQIIGIALCMIGLMLVARK